MKAEVVDSELVGGEPFELITKLEGEVCGVCGEEAGGVYFGATVCLPCKVSCDMRVWNRSTTNLLCDIQPDKFHCCSTCLRTDNT